MIAPIQDSGLPTALVLLIQKASMEAERAPPASLSVKGGAGGHKEEDGADDLWLTLGAQLVTSVSGDRSVGAMMVSCADDETVLHVSMIFPDYETNTITTVSEAS
jgi:NAD(P)H-dependent flavin oxidoreductase YrpB (nitropropane dioxygenase family)